MIKTNIVAGRNNKELHTYDGCDGSPILVTTKHKEHHGRFASQVLALAGTFTLVEAKESQGIVLTDLIISFEKKNAATVTIQFTDAVNTVSILLVTLTDAPVSMAIPFAGNWAGWQACDIKIVSSHATVGCVSVGYFRTPESLTPGYSEWDALR